MRQLVSRVAAVDCGTNTLRLLVLDPPDVILRRSHIVRLGEGVDATGRLSAAAIERTFAVVAEYADLLVDLDVAPEQLRFCATSATRDAANAEEFADGVAARLGVRPEVLSGTEEAALSFAGAIRQLADVARPVLVVDPGGGSTELVLGDSAPWQSCSLDVGSVRLTERHLHSDPPTAAEVAACVDDVEAALGGAPVDLASAATVVGVAGTVLTLAAGLDRTALPVDEVHALVDRLVGLTVAERRALGYVASGREDVIAAGGLIVSVVLRRCSVDTLLTSRADLLDGIAWSLAT